MPKKILVIGPSWIGDMVMTQSLFISLKRQNPESLIDVVAPNWSASVISRMGEVSKVLNLDIHHGKLGLIKRYRFGKKLKSNHYDQAIIIPRSFKAALVPFFAKIKIRTGFLGEMRYGLINDIREMDPVISSQTVTKMLALGLPPNTDIPNPVPYPILNIKPDLQERLIAKFKLAKNKPTLGIMPGAEYGLAKQWPAKNFAEIAQNALDKNQQVLLFGSAKDKKTCAQIKKLTGNKVINLSGKTSLEEAIDLLGLCQKVICNDSGLMHIAAAVGCEIHAIYGSSSAQYTPPLSNKAKIYSSNESCSPCFAKTCQFGHYNCLHNITPTEIIANVPG